MNSLEMLLSQAVFQAIGWALIHFIWQGALVASLLFVLNSLLLKRANASARYLVSCAALLWMLALPVATAVYIEGRAHARSTQAAQAANATTANAPDNSVANASTAPAATQVSYVYTALVWPVAAETWRPNRWFSLLMPWLVSIWLAGVLLLSLRVLGGWALTQRLARRALDAPTRAMQETLERLAAQLRVSRPVRLCESVLVEVPTVIGWLRPVILLPASALTGMSTRQLEALLAHELAHIRRHDYLVNLLQTAVETLLFYHPAVWWVSRRIRAERENCCDDLAVAACGDVLTYARALAELEQLRSDTPQLAVAANGGGGGLLMQRIRRLIEVPPPPAHRASAWLASVIVIATVFSIWASARTTILVADQSPDSIAASETARGASGEGRDTPDETGAPVSPQTEDREFDAQDERNLSADLAADLGAPLDKQLDPDTEEDRAEDAAQSAQEEKQRDAQLEKDVDEDTKEEKQDVIEGAPGAGDFISQMADAGYPKLTANQLVSFKIHGVTREFIRELRSLGYNNLSPDTLISMRIHGVTPDFIRGWSAQGFPNPTSEKLLSLRIHGVTPAFIGEIRQHLSDNPSLDDFISFRIHGVTPAFIAEMKQAGMRNLSSDDLISMRIHGVNAGFVSAVEAEGFDLSSGEAISLRIHGVTPEFIRQVKSRQFKDLTIEQLIALRRLGIIK
ncbi:MAG TPA: M56 family metallopeptidase [Pyrinomonadaceae bacterium]|nr:M56 family metallopeptidase [Pyrinomonadaceae bacterium]